VGNSIVLKKTARMELQLVNDARNPAMPVGHGLVGWLVGGFKVRWKLEGLDESTL
jgi:hypothetical protein